MLTYSCQGLETDEEHSCLVGCPVRTNPSAGGRQAVHNKGRVHSISLNDQVTGIFDCQASEGRQR